MYVYIYKLNKTKKLEIHSRHYPAQSQRQYDYNKIRVKHNKFCVT